MMLWSSTWSTCKCWFISEGVVEIADMSLLDLEYIIIFAALLGATGIACSMAGFGGLFPYYSAWFLGELWVCSHIFGIFQLFYLCLFFFGIPSRDVLSLIFIFCYLFF